MRALSPGTLIFTLLLGLLLVSGATQRADQLVFDGWLRLRGDRPPSEEVVIVALDEAFSEAYDVRLGQLDRRFYATAIENLTAAGVRAIGVDLFFPEETDQDQALAAAIAAAPVILPQVPARLTRPGERLPSDTRGFDREDHLRFNRLLENVPRGVIVLEESARRFRPELPFANGSLPSFPLQVARVAGLEPRWVGTRPMTIDWRGPAGSFETLSFLDIYRGSFAFSQLQGRVALVGVTLTGTDQDQLLTPFGPMPGVEVIANELFTLLHGRLRELPVALQLLLLAALGIVCPPLLRRRRGLLYALALSAGLVVASFIALLAGVVASPLLPAALPLLAYLGVSYGSLRKLDRELTGQLLQLLDGTVLGESEHGSIWPERGFAGHEVPGPAMLTTLLDAVDGSGGMLLYQGQNLRRGKIAAELERIAAETLRDGRPRRQGRLPHHLSEPLTADGGARGTVALTLPAPPPDRLDALIRSSAHAFAQLSRYRQLRFRTTSLASGLWPWQRQSSLAKIDALAMVTDLIGVERRWLGTLLESLPQALFIVSPYGYSVYTNAAARTLFGGERNLLQAVPAALTLEADRFQHDFVEMVEQGERFELALSTRSEGRPSLLTLQVVRRGDEVAGVAGAVSDVSRQVEADSVRNDLAALVVHDLRNPLTNILGFSELLLETTTDSEVQAQLETVRNEAQRMRSLTDEFLTLTRLEAGAMKAEPEPTDLPTLLRQRVASASGSASRKGITIALETPPQLVAEVDGDLLARALANLLSNAVKYSPPSSRVRVTLAELEPWITITVADDGYGMSVQQQRQLFERYHRLDEGPQARIEGTGLGLYLVRTVIEGHGGKIELESAPGEGTTVQLRLPAKLASVVG